MKKFFAKIHLWLSIPFGIIITILCLTGAILVFETEIKELTQPSLYKASEKSGETLGFDELVERISAQVPDSVVISSIQIPSAAGKNYRLGVAGQGRTSLLADPYTGEVRGVVQPYQKGSFFSFVRKLHRWFLFEMKREGISWGKLITGSSTLVFVFILVSGIVIWIPKTWKGLKRRLSIKKGAGRFRFWYDFHLSAGKTMSLLLLVMALTGLTWSFDWYRTGFYKIFGVESAQMSPRGGSGQGSGNESPSGSASRNESGERPRETTVKPEQSGQPPQGRGERGERDSYARTTGLAGETGAKEDARASRLLLDQHFAGGPSYNDNSGGTPEVRNGRANREENPGRQDRTDTAANWNLYQTVTESVMAIYPNFKTISIQEGTVSVAINRVGNTRASDTYRFDPATGEITEIIYYKDQPRSAKIRGWIYAVHVGSWGGLFTRILYFAACVAGAILPVTGYYIWLKKRWKKWAKKRRAAKA